ncbi:hypothetical protein LTY62_01895 [Limosilactobacillus balticus]|uniref:hypothetical protein n=1 Tax=Limosilactobacillus balticus TaxID=2759747 RepID=UPI001E3D560F|nr:hypothetical protein [Limosilactobacillus balticus]MCD7135998.1 hypothetical protein [Limosilactobacillus balticus]
MISDAIKILKEVQSLATDIKSKPLNDAIVRLQESVIDLSNNYLELSEKYNNLKEQVSTSQNVYLDDDGFICVKDDNRRFCPHCWNKDRRLSLMPKHGIDLGISQEISKPYAFECAGCKWIIYSANEDIYY